MSREREESAKRNQSAAEPDQCHQWFPPEPELPAPLVIALADDRVELPAEQGLDRRFVGLGRRVGEETRLRPQHMDSASPSCSKLRLDRRPVGPGDWRYILEAHQPGSD